MVPSNESGIVGISMLVIAFIQIVSNAGIERTCASCWS